MQWYRAGLICALAAGTLRAEEPKLIIELPEDAQAKAAVPLPGPTPPPGRPVAPIFNAVRGGNLPRIETEIARGADLNARGPQGYTPLLVAIVYPRQAALVKRLIEAGADPNLPDPRGLTPLYYSLWFDLPEITALLLDLHAKTRAIDARGDSALMTAAGFWRPRQINLLLARGEDPFEDGAAGRLIHFAAAHSGIALIEDLLAKGENINRAARNDGATPLMRAAISANGAAVRAVLGFKPDLDLQDHAGWTAAMHALWRDQPDMADLLFARGANPSLEAPSGETAFLLAAQRGYADQIEALANAGVSKKPFHLPAGAEALRELSPPQQRSLAMASIELYLHYLDLADFHRGSLDARGAAQLLQRSFDVKDAADLRAKLDFYLTTGERAASGEKQASVAGLSDEEFSARLDALAEDPVEIVALKEARRAAQRVGSHGLLAWDLCHHNFLAALGARAGFLRDEEAWAKMGAAEKVLRANYRGWKDIAADFKPGLIQKRTDRKRIEKLVTLFLDSSDPNSAWTIVPFD